MKTKLSWRTHNPTGWRQLVRELDLHPLEQWAVFRLLDLQWDDGHIPASPLDVAGLLRGFGLDPGLAKRVRIVLLLDSLFPVVRADPTRRRNPDLEEEYAFAKEYQRMASERGKAAAAARWRPTLVDDKVAAQGS